MFYGRSLREQARVFMRMADACDDERLAERLKAMANSLETMADESKMVPEPSTLTVPNESPVVPY
jgi:hypothetical protein